MDPLEKKLRGVELLSWERVLCPLVYVICTRARSNSNTVNKLRKLYVSPTQTICISYTKELQTSQPFTTNVFLNPLYFTKWNIVISTTLSILYLYNSTVYSVS